jgi:hypothetical protein
MPPGRRPSADSFVRNDFYGFVAPYLTAKVVSDLHRTLIKASETTQSANIESWT